MNEIDRIVQNALNEDIGGGDITTDSTISPSLTGKAIFIAKSDLMLAGMEFCRAAFYLVDPNVKFLPSAVDGDRLKSGAVIAKVEGAVRSILKSERVALNFLQRASGIATLTSKFVEKTAGTRAKILDTRKTAPGLRLLDKAAVKAGGGINHRFGLYDAILIKDNHIAAAGGIMKAVAASKKAAPGKTVEVEVTNETELREAVDSGTDIIMLDNMSAEEISRCVKIVAGRAKLEASGGVSLDTVAQIAATGVDFISVGALTHSAPAADISLEMEKS